MAFFGLIKKSPSARAEPSLKPEQDALFTLKRDALAAATRMAQGENRAPTLKDYIAAADGMRNRAEIEGLRWDARVYADLSGQKLDGFLINQADYKHAPEGFETNMNFTGATLHNCVLKPACVYDVTTGAYLENVTLDGMTQEETLTLKDTHHKGLGFENIKGGTIELADGAEVNGMNISRQHASLKLGQGATLNDLESSGARIVELSAAKGATLNRPHFKDTTISMASALSGSIWRGAKGKPTFENSNLSGTDFSGATLIDLTLENTDVKEWNLTGARISNLTIDGTRIESTAQLAALGITFDKANPPQISQSADKAKESAMQSAIDAGAGQALNSAMMSVLRPQKIEAPKPSASAVPPALANPGAEMDAPAIEGQPVEWIDPRNIWAQKQAPAQPPLPQHPQLKTLASSLQKAAKNQEVPEHLKVKAEKNEAFFARMRLEKLGRKDA